MGRRSVWAFYPNGEFGFQRRDSESGKSEGAKPFPRLPLNPFAVHLRLLLEAVLTSLLSGRAVSLFENGSEVSSLSRHRALGFSSLCLEASSLGALEKPHLS